VCQAKSGSGCEWHTGKSACVTDDASMDFWEGSKGQATEQRTD